MSYAIFQSLAVAAIVIWSVAFALRKWFPRSARAVQAKLARRLAASSMPLMHELGAKLTPQQVASGAGCGSGGGCSSCGACAPAGSRGKAMSAPNVRGPSAR
ncbi:MAG: hypothetical protein JSR65_03960 [Proteobacteria bacterium]|nr:hypothetical protein [Pseudomonadota bacterium]